MLSTLRIKPIGGVNAGFCRVAYHVAIEGRVNTEPTIPAIWQTKIATMSLEIFLISIKLPSKSVNENMTMQLSS